MLTIKKIINSRIWYSAVLALLLSLVIIPLLLIFIDSTPSTMPSGNHIKSGSRLFYNFLEKIKQTDDILVLGTSETGNNLNGNNYYSLLNKDKEFNKSVYALGGAGRAANVYFPLILENPSVFENLNIIYYINPTYWRKGLNQFSLTYFNRYTDSFLAYSVKGAAQQEGIFDDFMNPRLNSTYPFSRAIDKYKSLYYYDLNFLLESKKEDLLIKKINLNTIYDTSMVASLKHEVNLEFNVTDDFLKNNAGFPMINTESTYQDEMLFAFIQLCKKYKINCTFYLGPYNEIYCQEKNPELINEHRAVLKKIKNQLINSQVDFIDGTSISSVPGTFIDIQHISEYGAFLTALQIKEHYEKNK